MREASGASSSASRQQRRGGGDQLAVARSHAPVGQDGRVLKPGADAVAAGAFVSWVVSDAVDVWWLRWEVGLVATLVGLAGLPIALGIAIMRYRLHDIDIIINRTLVYGTLTAVMAGIFEVSVVTLQHVLLVLTHAEDSQLAYFVTAMVMAALFEPIKRRIDAFMERQLLRGEDHVGR